MQRKKRFTEESIIDEEYKKLFAEIKQCGMRTWDNRSEEEKKEKPVIIIDHPQYPSCTVLDFKNLYKFLIKLLGRDRHRTTNFRNAIDSSEIQWTTFRQGRSRNISSDIVKTGLEVAAEFFNIALIQLLADFLADCEEGDNKIRLAAHAQYEEVIKSFIREASELVAQQEAESAQISTQEIQEQSPIKNDGEVVEKFAEKPITKSNIPLKDPPYILKSDDKDNDENEISLNPYNLNSIPLFGREKQLDILNDFLKPKETLFSIMAIVGPSGAGKTRLVTEWFVENFIKNAGASQWQAGFIDSSD